MNTTAAASATGVISAPVAAGSKVAEQRSTAARGEPLTPVTQDRDAAVRAAASQIDSYLQSVSREVEFRVDDDTGMTVVTVRKKATGEVIRQIPNEEVLHLARRLAAGSGVLLDLKV